MSKVSRTILVLALVLVSAVAAVAAELPEIGKPAPSFTLRNQHGRGVSVEDFRGKWLVLYFYVRDFDRPDALQAKNFQRDLEKYKAANAEVVGISVDGPEVHESYAGVNKLTFQLLADTNADVSVAYNSFTQATKVAKFSARNTFVIDPNGNVAKIFTKVNPATSSDDVLKALAELQAKK